jgi:hypothetical protein
MPTRLPLPLTMPPQPQRQLTPARHLRHLLRVSLRYLRRRRRRTSDRVRVTLTALHLRRRPHQQARACVLLGAIQ